MGFCGLGSGWLAVASLESSVLPQHAWWEWLLFSVLVIVLLIVDLRSHRPNAPISIRSALIWSIVWIALALVFMAGIFWQRGTDMGLQFLTGYLVEKSLSVDNLFVFLVIFRAFRVAPAHQHRVLFWGVLGAIVMRAVLILFCVELVHYFSALFYLFGAVLLWSATKLFRDDKAEMEPENSLVVRLARRYLPFSPQGDGDRFFIRRDGRRLATPLLLVLVVVEASDLMFAVDSIPAVLAISQDYFIVLTSNIFAILGLRALYFVLQGLMDAFRFLSFGLALILAFIGVKLILMPKEGLVQVLELKLPTVWTLAVIGSILALSILASVLFPARPAAIQPAVPGPDPAVAADPPPAGSPDDRFDPPAAA